MKMFRFTTAAFAVLFTVTSVMNATNEEVPADAANIVTEAPVAPVAPAADAEQAVDPVEGPEVPVEGSDDHKTWQAAVKEAATPVAEPIYRRWYNNVNNALQTGFAKTKSGFGVAKEGAYNLVMPYSRRTTEEQRKEYVNSCNVEALNKDAGFMDKMKHYKNVSVNAVLKKSAEYPMAWDAFKYTSLVAAIAGSYLAYRYFSAPKSENEEMADALKQSVKDAEALQAKALDPKAQGYNLAVEFEFAMQDVAIQTALSKLHTIDAKTCAAVRAAQKAVCLAFAEVDKTHSAEANVKLNKAIDELAKQTKAAVKYFVAEKAPVATAAAAA